MEKEITLPTGSSWFMDLLKRQGFTVVILLGAVYFLWDRQDQLESKIDLCHERQVEVLVDVIERNTLALQNCK